MHFGLTEEQTLLQETLRGFIANECPPNRLRELFDSEQAHDPALWKGLAEMGLCGLIVPERYGGAGLEVLDLALCCEELGSGALPGPLPFHSLASLAIARGGSDAQRERFLPALASGEKVATIALAEPNDRWDPVEWSASVVEGAISGKKVHVPFADVADLLVVGTSDGGLAVVEQGAEGLQINAVASADRTRPLSEVILDSTPAEKLSQGSDVSAGIRDAGLAILAADAFGAAWALTRMTVEYAKTRQQFGRTLAEFQAVKHQLADMATTIEPTRGLYWYAAYACDHLADEAPRQAAIAKAHITDCAVEISRDAVELHGGLGFTWECDVQIWLKRALFDRAFQGTPDFHRMRSADLGGW